MPKHIYNLIMKCYFFKANVQMLCSIIHFYKDSVHVQLTWF